MDSIVAMSKDFILLVMEVERQSMHRYHFLSNVAIKLNQDGAEVECYGIATSTHDGKTLNFFGGRYHNSFNKTNQDWLMSRSDTFLIITSLLKSMILGMQWISFNLE